MQGDYISFHSSKGRRQILIVEDEFVNREILRNFLDSDFELLFAEDGLKALAQIREHRETLSLILLDLMMPGMNGQDVLRRMKSEQLSGIPVIVMTGDKEIETEMECLELGAVDFIGKPYNPGVVRARMDRIIELFEDRDTILQTERDRLTGLYNIVYFNRYINAYDQYHKDTPTDAIVVDINHFHMLSERCGKAKADTYLSRIAKKLQEAMNAMGGFACRREAGTFLLYCPHREDHREILENASIPLDDSDSNRIRLRMGVYANVDKALSIDRRFDYAKQASDKVRNSFSMAVGVYDDVLRQKELFTEMLLDEFRKAIEEKQFVIYYQPKFDVRPDIPVLAGAEALVRWIHPEKGMISPGVFIPLLEENGLIEELDHYVWRETARQIRIWKERFGFVVPVSVNVSRIDMYNPELIDILAGILEENDLTPHELLLEITESAYTQDSRQIIDTVKRLRELGFHIEMDDFGTGYSSLNMISTLPIDALKLDMQFVRTAFDKKKDTRMIEVIIDIADYLDVPVIAEGVETEEQLNALKAMGCDMVQGYYFSKPVPAEEYESFVRERSLLGDVPVPDKGPSPDPGNSLLTQITEALSRDYFSIYCVDTVDSSFAEYAPEGPQEQLEVVRTGEDFFDKGRNQLLETVYMEDRQMLQDALARESMLEAIRAKGLYTITYRMLHDGVPTYVHMKATGMDGIDGSHIVIGISDVDEQIKREKKYTAELRCAREMANRDALTGVKSKHAYLEMEKDINSRIGNKDMDPFAVVVCDVNDLKHVNDTRGHQAGDQWLKDACMRVCHIFEHSPVFRIGGDEFAAILRRSDFWIRMTLLERMLLQNQESMENGGVTAAIGMADFDPERDRSFADVFARADAAMYENKKEMKKTIR